MAEPSLSPIDYTARDYFAFRDALLGPGGLMSSRVPEWTSRSPSDFGVLLVEAFCWLADNQSFYGDRIANEAFLRTAVQRKSVLDIARMLDYAPHNGSPAQTTLTFTVTANVGEVFIPKCTQVSTVPVGDELPVVFELDDDLVIDSNTVTTGTAEATEGETFREILGASAGTPDQRFQLSQIPVVGIPEIHIREGDAITLSKWRYVENLLDVSGPQAVYTVETDENRVTYIVFGDDVNGRIPLFGAQTLATYRIGGGDRGNVPANTLTDMVNEIDNVVSVTNALAANGGVDRESLSDIRRNAPRSMRVQNRAITARDYADLALRVPGMVRSSAVYNGVTAGILDFSLYVAPNGGGALTAGDIAEITDYFDKKTAPNATFTVNSPAYVDIDVFLNLSVKENFDPERVQRAVEIAVAQAFDFTRQDFGQRISLGNLWASLNQITGVEYVVITKHARAADTGVADVVLATNEIAQLGTVTVTLV